MVKNNGARKVVGSRPRVGIRLHPKLLEKVDLLAAHQKRSRSAMIELVIACGLRNAKKDGLA